MIGEHGVHEDGERLDVVVEVCASLADVVARRAQVLQQRDLAGVDEQVLAGVEGVLRHLLEEMVAPGERGVGPAPDVHEHELGELADERDDARQVLEILAGH